MNKRVKVLVATVIGAALAIGGVALPANAQWNNGLIEPGEAAYYYSAGLTGALWDTDINTANYNINGLIWPLNQAQFIGVGSAGAGSYIYNNAHSMWNNKSSTGRSYYSVSYAGKYDTMAPIAWMNLVNTLNNNRSFKWI